MRLSERIDKALETRRLAIQPRQTQTESILPQTSPPLSQPPPSQPPPNQISLTNYKYQTLSEAIADAHNIPPDDDGLQVCVVSEIDIKSISLPLKIGKYIIEDIQSATDNGYEVHLTDVSSQK